VIAIVLAGIAAYGLTKQANPLDPMPNVIRMISAHDDLPFVVAEGQVYIELMEASKDQGRRLVFLKRAKGTTSIDPTNENEIVRLASIHPEYRVESYEDFTSTTRTFYLLCGFGTTDTTTPTLLAENWNGSIVNKFGRAALFKVTH
jgi:hypothetical protein